MSGDISSVAMILNYCSNCTVLTFVFSGLHPEGLVSQVVNFPAQKRKKLEMR